MKPFANESETADIDGLTVENRRDQIQLHGSLQITRDKKGLAAALELKDILDQAVKTLQDTKELPEVVQLSNAPRPAKSPFE